MKTSRWAPLAAALVLSGCAMASGPARPSNPPEDVPSEADAQDLKDADEALQKANAGLVVPRAHSDCQAVCKIADLICAASERICAIAARHSRDPAYVDRCRSAERDCGSAQADCDHCQ